MLPKTLLLGTDQELPPASPSLSKSGRNPSSSPSSDGGGPWCKPAFKGLSRKMDRRRTELISLGVGRTPSVAD